ncbi:hypothetical protein [Candidatus Nitrospira bockiana]
MDKQQVVEKFLHACDEVHDIIKEGNLITQIEKLRLETCTYKLRSILLFLENHQH